MHLLYWLNTVATGGQFIGLFAIFIHMAVTLPFILLAIKVLRYILGMIPFW